jgi:hypothetical protein
MFDIKKVEDKAFIYALNEFGTNAWYAHIQSAPNGISETDCHTLAILFKYSPRLFNVLDRIIKAYNTVNTNSDAGHIPDFFDNIMLNNAISQGREVVADIWNEETENRKKENK